MEKFRLPELWAGHTTEPVWGKPYGWCFRSRKLIEIYPPKWIPAWFGLRDFFSRVTWNHECLHAWGNPGCSNPFCPGYEGPNWKEYLAMPLQLLNGLAFCKKCLSHYKGD